MKKIGIISLLLIFVLSFGFAFDFSDLKPYHTEKYSLSIGYDGFIGDYHFGEADAGYVFGMKDNGHLNFDVNAEGKVAINYFSFPYYDLNIRGIALDYEILSGLDLNLHFGNFRADIDGNIDFLKEKERYFEYAANTDDNLFEFYADADFVYDFPVNNNSFIHFYDNNRLAYSKENEEKSIGANIDAGAGYYILREKNNFEDAYDLTYSINRTVDGESLASVDDIKNSFTFYGTLDSSNVINKEFTSQQLYANGVYNIAFAPKDNVLSVKAGISEICNISDSEKDVRFKYDAGTEYMLREDWGVNNLDTFKLDANLDLDFCVPVNGKNSFTFDVGSDVFFPRIIPVEMLDNYSLALPTELTFDYELYTSAERLSSRIDYSARVIPFYVEPKSGIKLFDMYINSVMLDAKYADAYTFTKGYKAENNKRELSAELKLNLDNVQFEKDTSSELSAEYVRDFNLKTNSVTIAFDAEF